MGIDRNNIPDNYYCELCESKPVDVERAKFIQRKKREEIGRLSFYFLIILYHLLMVIYYIDTSTIF